jgi:steroid 5-alpha reductase family enzyme
MFCDTLKETRSAMNLLVPLLVSLGINYLLFFFAFRSKTDKLTDLSYAITFVVLVFYGMLTTGVATAYQWILAAMVIVWAVRIGTFLFVRIRKTGVDHRFDDRRNSFIRFGAFWTLQALTVWVVMLSSLLFFEANSDPIGWFALLGIVVWAKGLIIESIADLQKYNFTQDKANKGRWIDSRLWARSRHPNYFGEMLVWLGVYVFTVSALEGTEQIIAAISPVFITFLLLFVSGVPLLEKSADVRWGSDKKYQQYKKRTPLFIPRVFK